METLPIDAVLPRLLDALAAGPAAVLSAPPGAGKTTRVPLALLDAAWLAGRVLVLEPRRVAARAAAERLAAGLGEPVGRSVGYRIRGESRPGSRIEVVTEGILTRMLQQAADLPGIGAILFDEVHERSIHTDLGLALALEVQQALRPELRLVAMSATLDVGRFARLLDGAPVIESAGRAHAVETRWLDRPWRRPGEGWRGEGRRGHVEAAVALILRALEETEAGDLLAFLPGAGEIGRAAARLGAERPALAVAELHGSLPFARQRAVLDPAPGGPRRVVLATSIAETSLTVPGVRVVVDAGLARRARTDPGTGLSRLVTLPVSRAEADQRRGRAGRLGPGACYRMWTRGEEGGLPGFAPPEIMETDLAPLALELAAWGAAPEELRWLDPPPAAGFAAARALLTDLGALDAGGRITEHGREMAAQPLHPRLAHMMVGARARGEAGEAALLAALLSDRDPLRGAGRRAGVDLRTRLRAVAGRDAPATAPADATADAPADATADATTVARIRAEAARILGGRGAGRSRAKAGAGSAVSAELLAGSLAGTLAAAAYPDRVALRRPGVEARYLLSGGRGAVLDAADPLAGERLLVATDLEDGPEARIRLATPIAEAGLRAVLGDRIRPVEFGRVVAPRRAVGAGRGAPARDAGRNRAGRRSAGGCARAAWRRAGGRHPRAWPRRDRLATGGSGAPRPGRLAARAGRRACRRIARLVRRRADGHARRLADAAHGRAAPGRADRPPGPDRDPAGDARLADAAGDRSTGAGALGDASRPSRDRLFGRAADRLGARAGAVRHRAPPDGGRAARAAADRAALARHAPGADDGRPARLLGRLVWRCPPRDAGTLSQAPLAGGSGRGAGDAAGKAARLSPTGARALPIADMRWQRRASPGIVRLDLPGREDPMPRSFVEMLRSEAPVLGTWAQMRAPEMVDLIGATGFDFAIVDCEHGAFGIETAEQLIRACDAVDLAPVLRVSRLDRVEIMKALDAGAGAVLVPNVNSAADAAAAVAATRYAPRGSRGACPCVRAGGHFIRDWRRHTDAAESRTGAIALVETVEGAAAFDEIVSTEGLAGVMVGPFDLAVAMGHCGDWRAPEVQTALEGMVDAARARGVPVIVPIFATEPAECRALADGWRDRGVRALALGSDKIIVADAFSRWTAAVGLR